MRDDTLILGAVAYDPKVVTIWDGFKEYFTARQLAFDYILYSNYERQVDGHFAGEIDVAWNSPLAWIETDRLARARGRTARAVAMRDSDCDLTSVILVRTDSVIQRPEELRGRIVAVGAADSPQATLIPLLRLLEAGLVPDEDFEVQRHDLSVGKHGDHIGGEREAVRALLTGRADAACLIDSNQLLFTREGTLAPGAARVLVQTRPYDHCNFTIVEPARTPLTNRFVELLLEMSYEDPAVRRLLDLEGLKAWRPGRIEGYVQLTRAVEAFGTLDSWLRERSG